MKHQTGDLADALRPTVHVRKAVAPLKQGKRHKGINWAGHTVHGRKAVAPLKPYLWKHTRVGKPAVHGRKAVAPLKQCGAARTLPPARAVHGRKAVAPLKPADRAYGEACKAAVHGRKAVAPLKLVVRSQGACTLGRPRPQGRGPIEARHGRPSAVPCLEQPSTAARPWPH